MKIKLGDKLVVKKDLSVENDFEKYGLGINRSMEKFAGKEVTVKAIKTEDDEKYIYIKEDDGEWTWTEAMFELEPKFKIGDIVYIDNSGCEYVNMNIIKYKSYYINYDQSSSIDSSSIFSVIDIIDDKIVVNDLRTNKIYIVEASGAIKAPSEIGQKVIVRSGDSKGTKGTVVETIGNLSKYRKNTFKLGIEFSRKKQGRHSCNGHCKDGYGYYYALSELELIEDVKEENQKETTEEKTETSEDVEKLTKEISKLTKEIRKRERFQDLMNEAVIEKGKEIAVEDLKEKLESELDNFIEEKYGVLPKKIEVVTETSHKELQGIFHKEFEKICKLVKANIPVMLTGGAGAGKNYTLEQVAEALDLDFYFSNSVNQEYKLTGFIDANGTYHETEFYKAFTRGGMFFLDEIDASSPECLVILNSAIANKYFDFPTGRVKAHENFRVVCAGNTYGTGADMVYVGRNVLDGATLDRFVVIPFDYDENVEKQLAYDADIYDFIYNLRKAVNECNLRYVISMRALINASKMLELGMDKQEILQTAIIKNMQIDDLNTIYSKLPESDWKKELNEFMKKIGVE